jgi:hypothetical protein
VVGEPDQLDSRSQSRPVHDADVDTAFEQPFLDRAAAAFDDLQRGFGKAAAERRDEAGGEQPFDQRRRSDADAAERCIAGRVQCLARALDLNEDAAGVVAQHLAALCESDTAAVAAKERLAQLDFQPPYLLAQRGLVYRELERGLREAPCLRHGQKVLKLLEIQDTSSFQLGITASLSAPRELDSSVS